MSRKHILVADDEYNTLLTMRFILEVADHRVTTAEDGREALDKILKAREGGSPFDLLITDIQMPGLTGLELLDELSRLKIDMPLLAITGYGNRELVMELIEKGCDKCLDKPIDDEELVKCVAELLAGKSQAEQEPEV
jgi:CheY-like chemotaxis protein